MSLLSLEKYLYGPASHRAPEPQQTPVTGFFGFAGRLIEAVRTGFRGQALQDLAGELDDIRGSLSPDMDAELLSASAARFETVLGNFQDRLKKADQERADDFRKVLATLKETFSQLSNGSQGADLRFQKLDESLEIAAKMDDLRTLRTHLTQTLQFVRQEASRERRHTRVLLDTIGTQIRSSQDNVGRLTGTLASRDAALYDMSRALGQQSEKEIHATIFVADILKRLTLLHGSGISDDLLDSFSRNRLSAIGPDGKVFRWTASSVLLLETGSNASRATSQTGPNSLFEYSAFLGDRVTNFRIAVRSLSLPMHGPLEEITYALDDFAREPKGA